MVGTPFKWTAEATTAVQELKQEAQSLPPLEPFFFLAPLFSPQMPLKTPGQPSC